MMAAQMSSKQMKRPKRGKSAAAADIELVEPSSKSSKLVISSPNNDAANRRNSAPSKQSPSMRGLRRLRSIDGSQVKPPLKATLIVPPSTEHPLDMNSVEEKPASRPRTQRKRFGHDLPLFTPSNRADWRQWLSECSLEDTHVWVIFHYKTNKRDTLSPDDAMEEAVAWGWMDARKQSLDAHRYRQLYTRRQPNSGWSTANKACVAKLMDDAGMQPSGQAAVETAMETGAWHQQDDSDDLVLHEDLGRALRDNTKAMHHFARFPDGSKRNLLRWVYQAKKSTTRALRIGEVVQQAELNLRAR